MKIGILSDTHNNLENLQTALDLFKNKGIDTLIHCGDLTEVEVTRAMQDFRVIFTLGNGDIASGEIRAALLAQNPENYVGLVFTGRIGEARVAATHGHLPGHVDELVHSGEYDYVFKGHSHQHKEETVGFTRLINPGALGGLRREDRHVCILDLDTSKAKFFKIKS